MQSLSASVSRFAVKLWSITPCVRESFLGIPIWNFQTLESKVKNNERNTDFVSDKQPYIPTILLFANYSLQFTILATRR